MDEEIKTSRFRIKGTDIKHGDTRYAEGDEIELSDEDAAPLKRWLTPCDASQDETGAKTDGGKNTGGKSGAKK